MTAHNLTVRIPEDLFRQIKERAAQRNRSVEDERAMLVRSRATALLHERGLT